jgi:hypothetical protein
MIWAICGAARLAAPALPGAATAAESFGASGSRSGWAARITKTL